MQDEDKNQEQLEDFKHSFVFFGELKFLDERGEAGNTSDLQNLEERDVADRWEDHLHVTVGDRGEEIDDEHTA